MIIDPSKVHLTEKDIEDWLWENPDVVMGSIRDAVSLKWLARQYKVPSGVIDLFGLLETEVLGSSFTNGLVIEVKNRPLISADVAQVCRYAADIENTIYTAQVIAEGWLHRNETQVLKMLVAPDPVENKIMFEANATNVYLHTFDVRLKLDLSGRVNWASEASEHHHKMNRESAESEVFFDFRQMAYENKLEREKQQNDKEPLPFTAENGDCSFAENGDLL